MNNQIGGWIITGRDSKGRAAPRQYLVCAIAKEEALATARHVLGQLRDIDIIGSADAIHFKRRAMKPGDVCEIGGKGNHFAGRVAP